MGLVSCQTQRHWVQLCAKPKQTWVWRAVRPNILRFNTYMGLANCKTQHLFIQLWLSPNKYGFGYALNPSTYEVGELSDPTLLGLATR
jgi:IS1 family transposase